MLSSRSDLHNNPPPLSHQRSTRSHSLATLTRELASWRGRRLDRLLIRRRLAGPGTRREAVKAAASASPQDRAVARIDAIATSL
jgi:IS4 transposase